MQLQLSPTADELIKPDQEALLTPEEFRALAIRVKRNVSPYQILLLLAVFCIPIAIILSALLSTWFGLILAIEGLIIYGIVNALVIGLFRAYAGKNRRHAARLLQFITNTQDVTMLGPILDLKESFDMIEHPAKRPIDLNSPIDKAVDEAVLRLLPLVQASDAISLNWEQRTHLLSYIWADGDFAGTRGLDSLPYARKVLQALEHIGGKHDFPEIERLLVTGDRLLIADDIKTELRDCAQHCIQVVRERAAREEGKDILLRADCKPQAVATLLRPSSENTETSSHELLRASTSEPIETKTNT